MQHCEDCPQEARAPEVDTNVARLPVPVTVPSVLGSKLLAYRIFVLLVNVRGRGHLERSGSDQFPNDDDSARSVCHFVSCLAQGLLETAVLPHRYQPVVN